MSRYYLDLEDCVGLKFDKSSESLSSLIGESIQVTLSAISSWVIEKPPFYVNDSNSIQGSWKDVQANTYVIIFGCRRPIKGHI